MVIADRDENELLGIRWLITSSSLPFASVQLANEIDEFVRLVEKERPHVVVFELDMIPADRFDDVKWRLAQYVKKVIVTTAETTFERAMEGIQIHAEELLVKPLSPVQLQRILKKCLREMDGEGIDSKISEGQQDHHLFYHSLFVEDGEVMDNHNTLFLIQPEHQHVIKSLHQALQGYPFQQPVTVLPLSDRIACLYPSTDWKQVEEEARRFIRDWYERSKGAVGVALPAKSLIGASIFDQYQDVKKGVQLFLYTGFRHVVALGEPVRWKHFDPFLSPSEQSNWQEMLSKGDPAELKEWMYNEFLQLQAPYPEPGLVKTRLTSILAQVRRYMKTLQLHENPSLEQVYQRVFDSILYQRLLYRIVQDMLLFIQTLIEEVEGNRLERQEDVADLCVDYMKAHFRNPDLSLEEVAIAVQRNPSYISSLIKDRKQKSYREILLSIRIDQAKQLLESTKEPVQQIAEHVGFSQANHFSRKFKESTGMKPSEYRNQKRRSLPEE